ncbi:non-ribosomal peptide synthetase [Pseudoalteromonas rubra]|uniref:Carrier domain-containing protein n=1 Tax=Pseudoalteromonas rubra TaxID=43658 RepID=A0A0F4QTU0_9GAMM|nr:non-ribosomal peptide synthetase [Pseudoalteromonas rubra]KJZ11131.1 hypothetical protein TW77_06310 [Pseudoalteromonas rubra]
MSISHLVKDAYEQGVLLFCSDGKLGFKLKNDNFPDALKEKIVSHKEELIAFLSEHNTTSQAGVSDAIAAIARDQDKYPLSYSQQRMWFMDRLSDENQAYHIFSAFEVEGEFDIRAAELAVTEIIKRHEILRSVYCEDDSGSWQSVLSDFEFKIAQFDLSAAPQDQTKSCIEARLGDEISRPFDLKSELMLRTSYFRTGSKRGVLLFNVHHIAADGWSMQLLVKEFVEYYQTVRGGGQIVPAPQAIQYIDFSSWQRQTLTLSEHNVSLQYWLEQLADAPDVHELPLDHTRASLSGNKGAVLHFNIDTEELVGLKNLARDNHSTLFMVLHAAFALLLARLSNNTDILIGTPVANRMSGPLEELVGCFVNTLVLRVDCDLRQSTEAYLAAVREVNINAQQHQAIPFEWLVDQLQVTRSASYPPLFQIMFAMDTNERQPFELDGLRLTPYNGDKRHAMFELSLDAQETPQGIAFSFEYNTDLFDRGSIELMADRLQRLLAQMVASPKQPIGRLALVSDTERQALLGMNEQNRMAYPSDRFIPQIIEQGMAHWSANTAVKELDKSLTYGELDRRANFLAHKLITSGIKKGDMVGVLLPRSADMVISFLAVLRAGAVYVPLNPEQPAQRTHSVLDEAQIATLLSHTGLIKTETTQIIALDQINWRDEAVQTAQAPCVEVCPQDRAYCIFTSGSTGKPKGVLVNHRAIASQFYAWREMYRLGPQVSQHLQMAGIGFDVSVGDMVRALCSGGTLHICPKDVLLEPAALLRTLVENKIDIAEFVPATVRSLIGHLRDLGQTLDQMKYLIVGSDAWSLTDHRQTQASLSADTRLINSYGLTECTVDSTYFSCENSITDHSGIANIGKAMPNVKIYVLNEYQQLQPQGSVGELYIGGESVAEGYLNLPQLNAERFLADPFSDDTDTKVFKTGDLVRYLPDGQLALVGRKDEQVKIRGFRIELGEIEYHLSELPQIKSCRIHIHQDEAGVKRIVAYAITDDNGLYDALEANCRAALTEKLPEYMVPAAFVFLDKWPLSINGKLDLKKLPAPEFGNAQYTAPETEQEALLASIWAELLQLNSNTLSVTESFFSLGGDSILSIQLVSRAAKQGLHFKVKDLFEHQTIRELSKCIQAGNTPEISQAPVTGSLELLPIQRDFFANPQAIDHYNQSIMLTAPSDMNLDLLTTMMEKILSRHDALRLRFFKAQGKWLGEHQALTAAKVASAATTYAWQERDYAQLGAFADTVQASLSIEKGELIKAVLIRPEHSQLESGRLLLVIHHLVVDGVSWRILLEDLETLYSQYSQGEPLALGPKTSSYQSWATFLSEYAKSEQLAAEAPHWQQVFAAPVDRFEQIAGRVRNGQQAVASERVGFRLSKVDTQRLLNLSHEAYGTNVNDLLMAGLMLGAHRFGQIKTLRVDLESHGRDVLYSELALHQTVGWFTAVVPKLLHMPQQMDNLGDVICAVKEQLRATPNEGLGFGVLKHLACSELLENCQASELEFNYLGQFDQVLNQQAAFKVASESSGRDVSEARAASHALSMTGVVMQGELAFNLSFDARVYQKQMLQNLMDSIAEALTDIAVHCTQAQVRRFTPSDFPLASVSQAELDLWSEDKIDDLYPATAMQQGLLFYSELEKDSYVEQVMMQFEGLDLARFKSAWTAVVDKHVIFRTAFKGGMSQAYHQVVYSDVELPWFVHDLSTHTDCEQVNQIEQTRSDIKLRGLDLQCAPLMQFDLFILGDGSCQVLWTHHHALLDGWSIPVVYGDVMANYKALSAGGCLTRDVDLSYRHYVAWLAQQNTTQALTYWRETLSLVDVATPLPLITQADANQVSAQVHTYPIELDPEQTRQLNTLANASCTTLSTLLNAAWALLLSRYSQEQTVVFGSTVSGRPAELVDVETTVGLFINTLPAVVVVEDDVPVVDWLQRLHREHNVRDEFGYLPLTEIQRQSDLAASLFDSLVVFENYPASDAMADAVADSDIRLVDTRFYDGTNYSVNVTAALSSTLAVTLEVQQHLLCRDQVAQIAGHLKNLLLNLAAGAALTVGEIDMLSETDKAHQIDELNDRHIAYRTDTLIHTLFEEQVAQRPDATAVFDKEQTSYAQLNRDAEMVATYLAGKGVKARDRVAICMDRSVTTVAVVLGILKVGAAYVPLDPELPSERKAYMLKDSGAVLLLTDQPQSGVEFAGEIETCQVEVILSVPGTELVHARANITPSDLAYIVYTSGTSGRPKGVMVEHGAMLARYEGWRQAFNLTKTPPRILQMAGVAVDIFLGDIVKSLGSGGALVMCNKETIISAPAMYTLIEQHRVTFGDFVPSVLRNLIEHAENNQVLLDSFKHILVGSEAWHGHELSRLQKLIAADAQVFNIYGQTESVIDVSCCDVSQMSIEAKHVVPLGTALANTSLFILDAQNRLVAKGATGELCIGGSGLARGYMNLPDLSAQKFTLDPFSADGGKLYRTGDLVRYNRSNILEFVGRNDNQVKIRGFRIELSEVEAKISAFPGVEHCVVKVLESQPGQKKLVAYIESPRSEEFTALCKNLKNYLPSYMVPSNFICLESFPISVTGKVDRAALPDVDEHVWSSNEYKAPEGETEQQLAAVWAHLLELPQETISREDDFFERGGHSLLIIKLINAVKERLCCELSVRDVFEHKTLDSMAALITERSVPDDALLASLASDVEHMTDEEVEAMLAELA